MAGSPVQSGATTHVFCSEQKVFGPPSSVSHELQNQRRDGGMEGSLPPTTSAINQPVALPAAKLRVKAGVKKISKKKKKKQKIKR